MGFITLSNLVALSTSIQVDQLSVTTLVVLGSQSVAGVSQFSAASFSGAVVASNVAAVNGSFSGSVNFAVATTAFSSDNAVALLASNRMYFTVEGTVARIYFNQTGTAVFRATINLGTF